jgi:hypothetical protein
MAQPAACAAPATVLSVPSPPTATTAPRLSRARAAACCATPASADGALGSSSPVRPAACSTVVMASSLASTPRLPEAALMTNSSGEAGSTTGGALI